MFGGVMFAGAPFAGVLEFSASPPPTPPLPVGGVVSALRVARGVTSTVR